MPHRGLTVLANSELITRLRYRLGGLYASLILKESLLKVLDVQQNYIHLFLEILVLYCFDMHECNFVVRLGRLISFLSFIDIGSNNYYVNCFVSKLIPGLYLLVPQNIVEVYCTPETQLFLCKSIKLYWSKKC